MLCCCIKEYTGSESLPLPPKVKEVMFSPLSVCLCLSVCTGYLKNLWMDLHETWLAGWVCDVDKLIRF